MTQRGNAFDRAVPQSPGARIARFRAAPHPPPMTPTTAAPARLRPIPTVIFAARWLQLPLYLGLILAMGIYVVQFWKEMMHILHIVAAKEISETEIMLGVLGLIDVVMIANLL